MTHTKEPPEFPGRFKTDISVGYEYHLPDTLHGKGTSSGSNIKAHYSQVLLGIGKKF